MFAKDIRDKIISEYKQELNNYQPEHIEKMVGLYDIVINYPVDQKSIEGVQKKLSYSVDKLYGNASETTDEELEILCESFFNIEPFLKKVLYIIDKSKYEQLAAQNKLMCAELMIQLGIMEPLKHSNGTYNFNANPNNYLNDNRQIDHVLEAYRLRNIEAHEVRLWNRIALFTNMQNIMITALYVCWKHRAKIEAMYDQYDKSVRLDVDDMMKRIIDRYKQNVKNGFKFISIKWSKQEEYGKSYSDVRSDMQIQTIHKDIGKRKHIMLLGEAGCGKTTSIEYLEYLDAEKWKQTKTSPIPVKILLGQVTDTWFSIEDYICEALNITIDYCRKLLNSGGIHLYLDGVNEMIGSSQVKRKTVVEIERFLSKYPNTFVVITDRENVEIKVDTDMPRFYLHQMDSDEIRDYIVQKAGNDETLIHRLMEYVEFMYESELRFTPIILNFIVEYAKRNESLPESSTDFYILYIKELLRRENEEKKDFNAAPGRLDSLLMYLSIYMEEEGLSDIQVLRLFAKCKRSLELEELDTKKCLDLSIQLGILEKYEENYRFSNPNYAECLFAEAMKKGMEEWDD